MSIKLDAGQRQRLGELVMRQIDPQAPPDDAALQKMILLTIAREYGGGRQGFQERQEIALRLFHSMRGLDLLQPLMDDPQVTEIMVNSPDHIYFERSGRIERSSLAFDDSSHLTGVITNFFGRANRLIHEKQPLNDMRLPDGSRVHAALPPAAPDGPVLTIRKFTGLRPDLDSLIGCDFISREAATYLADSVSSRQTVLVCGGTGTGKTTFLNILSSCIDARERIVTIEDAAELNLQGLPNLVRLEARSPGPDGSGEISLTDLIRASLRMRPDRIIVGEVRGREAFDMLQAMNTGHPGSLCTAHANSCADLIDRLSLMILMAVSLPWDAIHALIASAIQIVVHLRRAPGGKREVSEISRLEGATLDKVRMVSLYKREIAGELIRVS